MEPKRPLGVAIIVVFMVLNAGVMAIQLVGDTPFATRTQTLTDIHEWTPVFFAVVLAVSLLAAGGLWLGHRWAWALTMVMVGISLVLSLYLYQRGDPTYPRMVLDTAIAFYLNQGAVREYFERRRRPVGMEGPGRS